MVHEEAFSTVREFLAALDLSRWVANGGWDSSWVFRGQRCSVWALTPSAWRIEKTPPFVRLEVLKKQYRDSYSATISQRLAQDPRFQAATAPYVVEAYSQAQSEFALIREFVELADQVGHPTPGSDQYKNLQRYDFVSDLQNYPHVNFLPYPKGVTALAQHHGIPTRCLDWTKSAVIAAFFAAHEVTNAAASESIAVWAIKLDSLLLHGRPANRPEWSRFEAVYSPYEQNRYLHMQQGCFLFPTSGCAHFSNYGRWPELESFALSVAQQANESVIRKLTLPNSEVSELLRLLWLQGISKAHLMPTYDNVSQALTAKWRWLH